MYSLTPISHIFGSYKDVVNNVLIKFIFKNGQLGGAYAPSAPPPPPPLDPRSAIVEVGSLESLVDGVK